MAQSIVTNVARVTAPAGIDDPTPANNQASDSDVVLLKASSGTSVFSDSGQSLGNYATTSVGLGDVDGDVDLVEGNRFQGNRVWRNNGSGAFSDSGQTLGTRSVALGDVDGDGDLDLVEGKHPPGQPSVGQQRQRRLQRQRPDFGQQ